MKKLMYKTAAGVVAGALLLGMLATGAFAAEAINDDTGFMSDNFAFAADGSLIFVGNLNYEDVDNFSLALANSGFDWAGGSGGYNSVDSGAAGASTSVTTVVNNNSTTVILPDEGGDCTLLDWFLGLCPDGDVGGGAHAINRHTGAQSFNGALALDLDFVFVGNFNYADIDNFSFAIANSGFNAATGPGGRNSVETGMAEASTETVTKANRNRTRVDMGDGNTAEAVNDDTGFGSVNLAGALAVDAVGVANLNHADVLNVSVAVANSGVNYAGGSGGRNSVDTGMADASTKTETIVNDNCTDVEMNGASASAVNDGTGQDSLNIAGAADVDAALVVNANYADVDNDSVAVANSGVNAATGAGGHNSVETGDASASTETSTTANTNVTVIGGE